MVPVRESARDTVEIDRPVSSAMSFSVTFMLLKSGKNVFCSGCEKIFMNIEKNGTNFKMEVRFMGEIM